MKNCVSDEASCLFPVVWLEQLPCAKENGGPTICTIMRDVWRRTIHDDDDHDGCDQRSDDGYF